MDAQRTILIVALLIVSYLMVLAWNEDYGQQPYSQPSVSQTNDKPEVVASTPETHLDTPESLQASTPAAMATSATIETAGVIEVETDVLKVRISRSGGNLIEAQLRNYTRTLDSNEPLALLETSSHRTYVIQNGLIGKDGIDNGDKAPVYNVSANQFELAEGEDQLTVDLNYQTANGVSITKRYSFTRGDYAIRVSYLINNQSSEPWQANYTAKILRDDSPDPSQSNSMGMKSFLGAVVSTSAEPYTKHSFDDMQKSPVKVETSQGWIAFIQHYFVSALIPPQGVNATLQTKYAGNQYLMGFVLPRTQVEPGQQAEVSSSIYVGPKVFEYLEKTAPNLDLTVDYSWLWFIAKPLFLFIQFLHGFVGNWGVAIILVTILIKLAFFPLSAASYRSMANMRRVGPHLQRLKEQYGDDRQKMSQAMMELYRKEKINPLGGCLPILVQMPVFISLYWVLAESVQLRHAPFMLWIHDLSVKDPLFILPLLMGGTMFLQMHLNPTPPDPMQARVMKLMPIVFTIFFLWFPAGLVLYWLVNNVLSILQQWYINRQIEQGSTPKKA